MFLTRRTACPVIWFCVALFIALPPLATSSHAASDQVYTITGVDVDTTAKTAAQAREIALASGQKQALDLLLRQMTLTSDHARLPILTDADVPALVGGIEIANERTSTTRYLASLTVNFKQNAVRQLLSANGLAFTETHSPPRLVLPLFDDAGALLLWDAENAWRQAWLDMSAPAAPVPLIQPIGDLLDIGTISARQAADLDPGRMQAVADRYGVADLVVAHARLAVDYGSGGTRLDVAVHSRGPSGDDSWTENFAVPGGTLSAEVLSESAAKIWSRIVDQWKQGTLVRLDDETSLLVQAPLEGLKHWLAIRRRLEDSPVVRAVEVESLTTREARVVLRFLGAQQGLAVSLSQNDLDLIEQEGYWKLFLSSSVTVAQ